MSSLRQSVPTRLAVLLAFLGTLMALSASAPSPAMAENCNTEHTIFWGAWDNGAGHWRMSTNGSENHIILRNRTLDGNCVGHGVAWSTAHLMMGDQSNQAEVGYSLHLDTSGSEYLVWFMELEVAGHGPSVDNEQWPCVNHQTPAFGTNVGYRVQDISGSDDWEFFINCADGNGWKFAGSLNGGSSDIGTPMGETGRREQTLNATGMMDDQSGLSFLSGGTWSNDWNFPKCYSDPAGDNNWEGVKVVGSPTEYFTQQGSGSC